MKANTSKKCHSLDFLRNVPIFPKCMGSVPWVQFYEWQVPRVTGFLSIFLARCALVLALPALLVAMLVFLVP